MPEIKVTVSDDLKQRLEELANDDQRSVNIYCRHVLEDHIRMIEEDIDGEEG